MFEGKTLREVLNIIEDHTNDEFGEWDKIGYEYGKAFRSSGFDLSDIPIIWSEIFEEDFLECFNKGYYYQEIMEIISEGLKESIPDCIGLFPDYIHNFMSYDDSREKFGRVTVGFEFIDKPMVQVRIEAIDFDLSFQLVYPDVLDEVIASPLSDVNIHLESKKDRIDYLFAQLGSDHLYTHEEF